MFEYLGVIHVHSEFSDGTGKVDEIGAIADEVNLDFLILTDHNTLRALKEGYEKKYGKTLLLVGTEINDSKNRNHYLAFGVNKSFSSSTRLKAEEYIRKVKEAGGIGFIAHPHEKRKNFPEHPPFPWTAWDNQFFDGIEIWNHMSEWMEGLTEENKYQRVMHPLRSIIAPPEETLAKWDEIARNRKIVGIGGVDAHAHKVNILGIVEMEIFPYKVLFKSIRTHILLNEPLHESETEYGFEIAKKQIYGALKNGNCFVTNYYHGEAKGFRFFAESSGKKIKQGETLNFNKEIILTAVLPTEADIKLILNGREIYSDKTNFLQYKVREKGAYRLEAYKGKYGWIFSNHIRII